MYANVLLKLQPVKNIHDKLADPLINWNLRNLHIFISTIFLLISLFLIGFTGRKSRIILSLAIITTGLILFLLLVSRNKYGLSFFSFKF